MQYASLASGSKGNCHALTDGDRTLLIDVGISFKQILLRLDSLGWLLDRVQAVAITHEHTDHVAALPMILKRTQWALLTTPKTKVALEYAHGLSIPKERWLPLEAGRALDWQGWRLHPFSTPHDAVDPIAFRVEVGSATAAVMTDLGKPTALALDYAQDLDLLVLEFNHDIPTLREGPYPPHLKARILGQLGHLSNGSAAEMLQRVASSRLHHVVLAHLSEQNNLPELAHFAAVEALKGLCTTVRVASQHTPIQCDAGSLHAQTSWAVPQ